MATAITIKKVDRIRQIVQLKQVMKRWKSLGLKRRSALSESDSDPDSAAAAAASNRRIPPGYLAVYVGVERRRFVIPTRYLNLPIFAWLLKKSEEEFGFQSAGGLVIPVEVGFFRKVLKLLEKDEHRFGKMKLEAFLNMFAAADVAGCRDANESSGGGRGAHGFTTPLLKARV